MGAATRRWVRPLAVVGLLVLLAAPGAAVPDEEGLRSELYPTDWQPGLTDGEGRFLHDFSYAGYRYGADVPDAVAGEVYDVTQPPYGADPDGERDATEAIQAAIDDAGAAGGGTVHLPAGTFRVGPDGTSRAVLHIPHDGVLLRGDGPDRTRLVNASADGMRQTAVVLIGPDRSDWQSWHDDAVGPAVPLTRDVDEPTRTLHVANPAAFTVGDWVVLRAETTDAWLREHRLADGGTWEPDALDALVYHRRVTAADPDEGTVDIDIPTRYPMRLRDGLRLQRFPAPVTGSGVADLAVGMRQSDRREEDPEEDHEDRGTAGYQAHQASAIAFNNAVDGWVARVRSFRPEGNDDDVHLLSVGIYVRDARNITIVDADLRNPQYRGAGGNGYLYHLMGSDTLVRDSRAEGGRHNYLVQGVQATGNVVLDSLAVDGERATELHRHLSAANLVDNLAVDGDTLEMVYRESSDHAHSGTESVMWNVSGERCTRGRLAESQQYGWGYVVGTSGTGDCANVENPGGSGTEPRDWVEHVGEGDRLEPRSLYLDQRERRVSGEERRPAVEVGGVRPVAVVVGGVVLLVGVAAVGLAARRSRRT
ncbi:MAG TPA: glycosyl hydrolase family 28-related protein [Phototrophicaceae bacterium]|nr:glycosyl hydrolase family 28-related protein [Phototrophicaceae bacterium]